MNLLNFASLNAAWHEAIGSGLAKDAKLKIRVLQKSILFKFI